MMTIDLKKSLVKKKRAQIVKKEKLLLNKAEMLEKEVTQSEMQVLNRIGMNVENRTNVSNIKTRIEKLNKYPADLIFHESDIKKLCVRYRLRFLESPFYNGDIDAELPKKILEFEKQYQTQCGHNTQNKTYICAPKSSFKLQERSKDPLFFVKVDDEHYFLLHKWGNDISWSRWLTTIPIRNTFNFLMFSLIITNSVLFCINYFHSGNIFGIGENRSFFLIPIVLSSVCAFFAYNLYTVSTWNDKIRR